MKRARLTWLAFALCLAVVLAAMAWASVKVLDLDASEARALRQAALEERVRLALWRMDSSVGALAAMENSRPYFLYSAFHSPNRAYNGMYQELRPDEILVPSPLLTSRPPHVRLHFQIAPDGELSSPQAPTGNMRDLAESGYISVQQAQQADQELARLKELVRRDELLAVLSAVPAATTTQPRPAYPSRSGGWYASKDRQFLLNNLERQAREQQQNFANETNTANRLVIPSQDSRLDNTANTTNSANTILPQLPVQPQVVEGAFQPVWRGAELLLVRRVEVGGQTYVQGCHLDWPGLRDSLLESVRDLLPAAELSPASGDSPESAARLLASLPVRLAPGAVQDEVRMPLSPLWVSLAVAWGCVILASAAAALLLRSAVVLGQRQGAFVAAVTHELRTPLTTFRLYAEMLADGMVTDEGKRRSYLSTLRGQADRLGHLVQNVLSYARLDGPRGRADARPIGLSDLMETLAPRLQQRAEQAGMTIQVRPPEADLCVKADPSAVEQIFLNLVDNACKYASAADKRIEFFSRTADGAGLLCLRDYGPGVPADYAKRLFRPFSKSADEAAGSAPGIGLGLALSRRLARAMGGELKYEPAAGGGACFVLALPQTAESNTADRT